MVRVLLENITKKYGDVTAVNDLNIEVRDREFLVLVGPSGCGKSTALRMIAGLEDITSGSLYIGANLVNEVPPKDRDIAMVFQSYALYPHMNVYDNMAFGLRLRKNIPNIDFPANNGNVKGSDGANGKAPSKAPTSMNILVNRSAREAAIRKRVEAVADSIGLRPYLNRKPSQLSGGQRQRVALGRAIARQPQVFLMDEPLSNLDAKMRVSTRAELQKLHRSLKVTTIYVTHDQVEAMTMGDRIAVMKDGMLQQLDTPRNLYARPANVFVAGFIGSPAMNMFSVDVEGPTREGEDGGLFMKGPGFRIRVPEHHARYLADYKGKKVLLGLRPESIQDARFRRDADPTSIVTARIEVREPLGGVVYLYASTDGQPFVARVDDRTAVWPGQDIKLVFDTTNMNAFDPDTQRAIL